MERFFEKHPILTFVLVFILIAFIHHSFQYHRIPSTHEDIIIYAKRGYITILLVIVFWGMLHLVFFIFKSDRKLEKILFSILIFLGLGLFIRYRYYIPYSNKVIINKSEDYIKIEEYYILRKNSNKILFSDINYVEYEESYSPGGEGFSDYIETVNIYLINGKGCINISSEGRRSLHELAKTISESSKKRLVEEVDSP